MRILMNLKRAAALACATLLGVVGTSLVDPFGLASVQRTELRAQDRQPGATGRVPRTELRCILKSVDATKSTITVLIFEARPNEGRREPEEKTFQVAKDAEVGVSVGDGRGRGYLREARIADLTAGVAMSLSLSADQKIVEGITAEGPSVRGVVKSVDAANNTLTVEVRPGGRGEDAVEKTLTMSVTAEIGIDDGRGKRFSVKEGKLADVSAGSVAVLWLTIDQKLVSAAQFEGPTVFGVIKSIDINKNTVTVSQPPGRGDAEEKTYELTKDTLSLIDDGKGKRFSVKEGKLQDMPVGSTVFLKLSADQKQVGMIRAEGPNLAALIKAVDATKGTVTFVTPVRGENPEERTLSLAKDARLMMDNAPIKLADVKVEENGPFAQLKLSLDQKSVQSLTIGRGR